MRALVAPLATGLALLCASCFSPSEVAVDCGGGVFCPAGTTCLPGGGCSGGGGMPDLTVPLMCMSNECAVMGVCTPWGAMGCGMGCPVCTSTDPHAMAICNVTPTTGTCSTVCLGGYCMSTNGKCLDNSNDPNNCGLCGRKCPSGMCAGGLCAPERIAVANNPVGLVLPPGAGSLVWADNGSTTTGAIEQLSPIMPGTSSIKLAIGLDLPFAVATDSNFVYWTSRDNPNGNVYRNALGSPASPTPLGTGGQMGPYDVTVDDANVYWTDQEGGTINKVSKTLGSPPVVLASGQMSPRGIALNNSGKVFWVNHTEGVIYSISTTPAMGEKPKTEAGGMKNPESVFLANGLLWITDDTTIRFLDNNKGVTIAVMGRHLPFAMTADSTFLYFTERGTAPGYIDGQITKVTLAQGQPYIVTKMADNVANPWGIAVDKNYVYFSSNAAPGGIYRIPAH